MLRRARDLTAIAVLAMALGLPLPAGAAAATLALERLPAVGTGAEPLGPLIVDADGDGAVDVITPNFGGASISVLRGRGDGSFEPKEDFPAGPGPTSVAGGDLRTGLGRVDLAVGNYGAGFSLLDAQPDGTYRKRGATGTATVAVPVGIYDLAVVFGTPEPWLAFAGYAGGGAVGLGIGSCSQDDIELPPFHCPGAFGAPTLVPLSPSFSFPRALAPAYTASGVEVAITDGVGGGIRRASLDVDLGEWVPVGGLIATGGGVADVEAADMDGDGDADYVTADETDDAASLLLRDGTGFTRSVVARGCEGPTDVALGDLDRDGKNDIVIVCATGELQVHLNRGDGTFAPTPVLRGDGVAFSAVALGDIDGDRGLDVLGISRASASVTPFRSSPAPTAAPARVAFAELDALTASSPVAIRVGTAASGDVAVTGASITGPGAIHFALVANGCVGAGGAPVPVGPAETCSVMVRFAPRDIGRLAARLELTFARGGPLSVPLAGVGVRPGKPRLTAVSAGPAPRRRGARVALTLSRAARVTVTLQRRVGRRLVQVAKVQRARGFGASTITLGTRLGAGRYRVVVGAVDGRGRRAATVVRTFRLRAL